MLTLRSISSSRLIALGSLIGLVITELVLQFLLRPSEISKEKVWRIDLPPFNMTYAPSGEKHPTGLEAAEQPFKRPTDLKINLTRGDVRGAFIADPVIGYRIQPNFLSANGWFQSNNIGARSRNNTEMEVRPDTRRVLFFGDSNTKGVAPQEDTFIDQLDNRIPGSEMLNFGVDGYGSGQAYLLYQSINQNLNYDHVVLVLVPEASLWRDINVNRYIVKGWKTRGLSARFILKNGQLTPISPPFDSIEKLLKSDPEGIELRAHSVKYDSFYNPMLHDHHFMDWSVIWRIFRRFIGMHELRETIERLYLPGSEATLMAQTIAADMQRSASEAGSTFSLVLLPSQTDIVNYNDSEQGKLKWQAMKEFVCEPVSECIDLMPHLSELDTSELDKAVDGGHYGPIANRKITDFLVPYFD